MRLPDFICVGAQKSGTTWLYRQLSEHPQVFMRTKELDYFFGPKDLTWYQKQFDGALPSQRCGDISPNYAAFIDVSARIYEHCPNAVILHVLRDPVDRAYSQWKMARHLGNIPRDISFIEAFRTNQQYIRRRGEYSLILREYARYYPLQKSSRVFWYDDIKKRPADLLRQVLNFINIDPNWSSPYINEVVWPSPERGIINAEDASEARLYYEPFDKELCFVLGLDRLPWHGR